MQATHATSDMRWAEMRVGPQRVLGAYAWQRFLNWGYRWPTDRTFQWRRPIRCPVSTLRLPARVGTGSPPAGWQPDQRMTREQALKSWTLDGAFAAFEEERKGSLPARANLPISCSFPTTS